MLTNAVRDLSSLRAADAEGSRGLPGAASVERIVRELERDPQKLAWFRKYGSIPGAGNDADDPALYRAVSRRIEGRPLDGTELTNDTSSTSWTPIDLEALLEGEGSAPRPSMLTREDGVRLLYPGKLHSAQGEPESGKGWLALLASVERLRANEHVLYLDFEDSASSILERLILLGADPEAACTRFHYSRPDEPLSESGWREVQKILSGGPTIAVIDGLTEALTLHGLDLRDNVDVAKWLELLPRRLARSGAAVLQIDHVTKDKESRGRFAIGAQHKLAAIDVAFTVEVVEPFGRGREGHARVAVTKDRPGHIRQHALDGKWIANLRLASDRLGRVKAKLEAPEGPGPFRPTYLMEQIWHAVEANPGLSKSNVRSVVSGKSDAKDRALDLLVAEGYIEVRRDGQAHRHYCVRPYRQEEGGP